MISFFELWLLIFLFINLALILSINSKLNAQIRWTNFAMKEFEEKHNNLVKENKK